MPRLNCLESRYYPRIATFMLQPGAAPAPEDTPFSDFSFAGQAHLLDEADAVICTAYSAVPVADAVRGYFEERGEKPPYIGYVRTSFKPEGGVYTPRDLESFNMETERMNKEIDGIHSAVIIDQLVCSRAAINVGRHVLLAAGASSVDQMTGRWYIQAYHPEVTLEKTTSTHAEFMREVGRKTARQELSVE